MPLSLNTTVLKTKRHPKLLGTSKVQFIEFTALRRAMSPLAHYQMDRTAKIIH